MGIIIVVFFFMVVGVVSVFGLFPGVDLSSFFKENWDWIVSVFIAVVAVFVSTFSLFAQRHHNKLSVMPDIVLSTEEDLVIGQRCEVRLVLKNVGYGTGKILSANLCLNGESFDDKSRLSGFIYDRIARDSAGKELDVFEYSGCIPNLDGVAIPAGGCFTIKKYSCGDVSTAKVVSNSLDREVSIVGRYQSSYGEVRNFGDI